MSSAALKQTLSAGSVNQRWLITKFVCRSLYKCMPGQGGGWIREFVNTPQSILATQTVDGEWVKMPDLGGQIQSWEEGLLCGYHSSHRLGVFISEEVPDLP